jgi:hypothetical protein
MRRSLLFALLFFVGIAQAQFTGSYNVGTGETYTTLKSLFDAINAGTVDGDITINITSDLTEASNIGLGVNTNGYHITIQPSADVSRTVTFTQLADNTSPTGHLVIGYPGSGLTSAYSDANTIATSRVTINGYASGGSTRRLTFTNTAAAHVGARVIVVVGACDSVIVKKLHCEQFDHINIFAVLRRCGGTQRDGDRCCPKQFDFREQCFDLHRRQRVDGCAFDEFRNPDLIDHRICVQEQSGDGSPASA